MRLDPRQARAWQRLGLGPLWTVRAAAPSADTAGQVDAAMAASTPGAGAVADMDWDVLQDAVAACTACALCKTRTQTVFGVGSRTSEWMLIGEAPGAEEDLRGEPFVGQAGRLLDAILATAGLDRAGSAQSAVYIANVLKCRPPGNRNPEPEEVARCEPFLWRQIGLLKPRIVLVMGRFAAQSLLGSDASIASLLGRDHSFDAAGDGAARVGSTARA